MPYISNTDSERKKMLSAIGVKKFEDLISNIPKKLKLESDLDLTNPQSELEMDEKMSKLAAKNRTTSEYNSFLGGGVYDHFIPAAVDHVTLKPEFHSAYTPYQAEVSQGTLQMIYEYQTMICELTGMEIANASMYDGATAAAEAILMAVRKTKKNKAIIAETINPLYKRVIEVYTNGIGIELSFINSNNGVIDLEDLKDKMDNNTACVLLQTPNFFGNIENAFEIEAIVHNSKKALFITAVDPISLALLNAPSEYKADIVIGEGQALGNSQYFGGPLFGFFATKLKLKRMMPGRISGATIDKDGNRSYALTLQTREQHIRRAKAISNICSNQSLNTLAATVYFSLMGRKGLIKVAEQSTTKAHYLANEIQKLNGFELKYNQNFFKEFVVKTPEKASDVIKKMKKKNIFAGIDLSEFGYSKELLIAVTEKKTKSKLDAFISALKEVYNG